MALTQTQIEKIATLFTSEDLSYAKQGIELVEALIDNERDFVTLLERIGSCTLTDFTFDELESVFGFVKKRNNRSYLAVWALGTLAQWNTTIQNLTFLNLYGNQLAELPKTIKNLSNLTYLGLNQNRLVSLPESLENLTNLTKLSLRKNPLESLPNNLVALRLDTEQWERFQHQISNMTDLKTLDLSYNELTTLPESIGNLNNLNILYLGGNAFTTLPESIGNLNNLNILYLHENPISESEQVRIQALLPNCEIGF